jgi:glutamate N-acetyltransferase / amino-acid N-acetyltransferase
MFSGMRAKGPKADLALIVADAPAAAAGVYTTNVMAAAPVTFCRQALQSSPTAQAVGAPACVGSASSAAYEVILEKRAAGIVIVVERQLVLSDAVTVSRCSSMQDRQMRLQGEKVTR